MEILSLSTSRNILKEGSRDRARMKLYAKHLTALHIVVLTQRKHELSAVEIHDGALHLYPTHAHTKIGMLASAFCIAWRILRERKGGSVSITSQDPLELGSAALILACIFMVPLNIQVHGDYFSPAWGGTSLAKGVRRMLARYVLNRASSIRVVSERIKLSLRVVGIPEDKITVLPIRPELDVFLKAVRTRPVDDVFVILTASRLAPEKDIRRLISAFRILHKKYPHTHLRIAGTGEEENILRMHARESGCEDSVIFVPWTEHIESEMANADVFALASKHEAYALVLVEALATGVPVVTTDVGCVGEVVVDRTHGLVVHSEGVESYGEALIDMYEDKAFRLSAGKAGHRLGTELARLSEDEYGKKWVDAHIPQNSDVY